MEEGRGGAPELGEGGGPWPPGPPLGPPMQRGGDFEPSYDEKGNCSHSVTKRIFSHQCNKRTVSDVHVSIRTPTSSKINRMLRRNG